MARAPLPGRCKTRLAAALGDEGAARLYEAMLRDTLAAMAAVACRRVILAAPEHDGVAILSRLAPPGFEVLPQETGGLGERLAGAFRALCSDRGPVAVIGSDAPLAPLAAIGPALTAQTTCSWVLAGPAADGGYWSIAMPSLVPEAFERIPWSTAQVFDRTRARCAAAGIPFEALPPSYDVDEPRDLERARADLRAHPERAPRTAQVLFS